MRFSAPAAAPYGADELLDIWRTVAGRHLAFGGCACGVDGVVLKLEDFEADILDYLHDEARRNERADVEAFLKTHEQEAGGRASVGAILTALATTTEDAPRTFLLVRLGRTLGTFAETHGTPRRFAAT